MTTATYLICDKCGDEIKDDKYYAEMDTDNHYHEHCIKALIGIV